MAVDPQDDGSRNTGRRVALVIGTLAVLVVAFLLLRGGGDDNGDQASTGSAQSTTQQTQSTTQQQQPTSTEDQGTTEDSSSDQGQAARTAVIRVADGKPVGGVQKLTFKQGGRVQFVVRSTTEVPIHFHGYDVEEDAKPGKPASFDVKAGISGRFEVEVESTGTQIAE